MRDGRGWNQGVSSASFGHDWLAQAHESAKDEKQRRAAEKAARDRAHAAHKRWKDRISHGGHGPKSEDHGRGRAKH